MNRNLQPYEPQFRTDSVRQLYRRIDRDLEYPMLTAVSLDTEVVNSKVTSEVLGMVALYAETYNDKGLESLKIQRSKRIDVVLSYLEHGREANSDLTQAQLTVSLNKVARRISLELNKFACL